jgi:thiol-disulfide isomerase/thioredoxin
MLAAALALSAATSFVCADDIRKEGDGKRRADLNAMELKPAPDIWSRLSDWTGGSALSSAAVKDKVVLIGTWYGAYKASHTALDLLDQLNQKYGADGLVVVAIHRSAGWDDAVKSAADRKILLAHDATDQVRSTLLLVDQDPDFYLIDRAGNLRYADVVTGSVEDAVKQLVSETPDAAAALPGKLAGAAAARRVEADRTRTISSEIKPGQVLDVAFTLPDPEAYSAVKWPEHNTNLSATSVQGNALPVSLGNETWITKQPNTNGRVIVLDWWATWCGPCKRAMPGLDSLQKEHKQDLVIIGVSGQPAGNYKEDIESVKSFLQGHKSAYSHANDLSQNIYKALNIQGIPHVAVLSTDGIVRWQGNPLDPSFAKAVKTVIAADPGVSARRKAEAEFLKKRSGG